MDAEDATARVALLLAFVGCASYRVLPCSVARAAWVLDLSRTLYTDVPRAPFKLAARLLSAGTAAPEAEVGGGEGPAAEVQVVLAPQAQPEDGGDAACVDTVACTFNTGELRDKPCQPLSPCEIACAPVLPLPARADYCWAGMGWAGLVCGCVTSVHLDGTARHADLSEAPSLPAFLCADEAPSPCVSMMA